MLSGTTDTSCKKTGQLTLMTILLGVTIQLSSLLQPLLTKLKLKSLLKKTRTRARLALGGNQTSLLDLTGVHNSQITGLTIGFWSHEPLWVQLLSGSRGQRLIPRAADSAFADLHLGFCCCWPASRSWPPGPPVLLRSFLPATDTQHSPVLSAQHLTHPAIT